MQVQRPGTPVVVRACARIGSVALGVEDRGCGLAAEDLSRVFEPFFRGEQARRDGPAGVGLGLAVAQRIAATFGGTLDVRSEPGAGSLFVLRLPDAVEPGGRTGRSESPKPQRGAARCRAEQLANIP